MNEIVRCPAQYSTEGANSVFPPVCLLSLKPVWKYLIQLSFICRASDSAVSEDAGIEPRTFFLICHWRSDALTQRVDRVPVPEFIDPVFGENKPLLENERFGFVFAKTGCKRCVMLCFVAVPLIPIITY